MNKGYRSIPKGPPTDLEARKKKVLLQQKRKTLQKLKELLRPPASQTNHDGNQFISSKWNRNFRKMITKLFVQTECEIITPTKYV